MEHTGRKFHTPDAPAASKDASTEKTKSTATGAARDAMITIGVNAASIPRPSFKVQRRGPREKGPNFRRGILRFFFSF